MVTNVSPTSALGLIDKETNPPQSELDAKKLADDFDDFLLLLTTQLENQDPTEPLDTNEFTSQLVQFASVEQQVATNANIEKLVNATLSTGIQQGLGYIGKAIDAVGNKGVLAEGQGIFSYELPQRADKVEVTILDNSGRAVFSGQGNPEAGKNIVVWDGKNSFSGQQMPEGTYQIVVSAKDFKGQEIKATTYTTGRVSAAELNKDGQTILSVGSQKIPISDVIAVREPVTYSLPPEEEQSAANDNSDNNS